MNMIVTALAVLAGTLCLQWLPVLPSSAFAVPLTTAAILLAIPPRARVLSWCIAGFLWAWLQAEVRLAADLPPELEGVDLVLRGTVDSLPESNGRATRFLFAAQTMRLGSMPSAEWTAFSRYLRLSWYDAPAVQAGEGWELRVRLKRRQGFHNPGGFDYAGWLFHNGINATGYVRPGGDTRGWDAPPPAADLRLRAAVASRLETAFAGAPQPGLLRALTLGARDGIDARQWSVLRATGTGHLVAISGLHIGLVAGLAFVCGRALWARSHTCTLWLAAPRAAALAALLAATLYAVLAGFGIPTRRAWIMALVVLLGVLWQRPVRPVYGLSLALLLVVLADPFAVLSPGFWLSFAAVAIIFARLAQPATRADGLYPRFRRLLRLQVALTLGLLPLTLLFFGQLGWVALPANLFAVPWTSLVLVPLLFAGLICLFPLPALAQWLFWLAGWAAELMQHVLALFAALPGAAIGMPAVSLGATLAAVAGVMLLLLPRGVPRRALGWVLLLPLISASPPRPPPGQAWFTLLDVGQGLAAVVRTHRHTLVYDTGPRFSADFDTGDAVVAPFLLAQAVRRVDTLIISHGDNDHRGGAASLDRRVPAYHVLSSVPQRIDWRYATPCVAGQAWEWDGVRFRMLHPPAIADARGNNASCVLQVETANGERLLLPGDIESAAERTLVSLAGEALRSHVLIAPHHGSRSSSTAAFVQAVAPEAVLFPTGYRNRYGFPNPVVTARYQALGVKMLNTAETGAIQIRLGARARGPVLERQRVQRYWHLPAAVPPDS
ncbi:MAG: DNA internalization-related competence protein ComEC/Rec2 [Gammaproteobacteria bacterium]